MSKVNHHTSSIDWPLSIALWKITTGIHRVIVVLRGLYPGVMVTMVCRDCSPVTSIFDDFHMEKNNTCRCGWWFGCHFWFSHILGILIPIDFHIFQRGGWTTNQLWRIGESAMFDDTRGSVWYILIPSSADEPNCIRHLPWVTQPATSYLIWNTRTSYSHNTVTVCKFPLFWDIYTNDQALLAQFGSKCPQFCWSYPNYQSWRRWTITSSQLAIVQDLVTTLNSIEYDGFIRVLLHPTEATPHTH